MHARLPESILRTIKPAFGRKYVLELVMTFGVIGLSFFLVALVLMRLTGDAETTELKKETIPEPPAAVAMSNHHEIELGTFSVTSTPAQQSMLGESRRHASILQFDASVMVQDGNRSRRVQTVFGRYRNRLNAEVDAVTRKATADEIRDPELSSLRGKIRSNVNRLLGGNIVDDVIVSDFRHFRLPSEQQ